MWEPTRQSPLLRRHPGSLGLLALLLSAAAELCLTPYELQRHHKTSDDDIEVLYVFDDEALFQYRFPTFDGKRSYRLDLVRAVPGEEPEVATASRALAEASCESTTASAFSSASSFFSGIGVSTAAAAGVSSGPMSVSPSIAVIFTRRSASCSSGSKSSIFRHCLDQWLAPQ